MPAATISMGPWSQRRDGGVEPLDPFKTMGELMNIRNAQTSFTAKQRAGAIVATGDPNDPEGVARALESDPLVAGYNPEAITLQRQLMQTQAETGRLQAATRGELSSQGRDAYADVAGGFIAAYADPSQLVSGVMGRLAKYPLSLQAQIQPSLSIALEGFTHGLDLDPSHPNYKTNLAQFQQRINGAMISLNQQEKVLAATGQPAPRYEDLPPTPGLAEPRRGVVGGVPLTGPDTGGGGGGAQVPSQLAMPTEAPTGFGAGGLQLPAQAPAVRTGLEVPGARGVTTGPVPGTAEQVKAISDEMATSAQSLPASAKQLDMLHDALTQFRAGGLAGERALMGRDIQGIRNTLIDMGFDRESIDKYVPQSLIDKVGNGDLAATQVFNSIIRSFVTERMREAVGRTGAGRLQAEVKAYLDSADASTSPEALLKMLNQTRFGMQVAADRVQSWPEFRDMVRSGDPSVAGLTGSDFYLWHSKNRLPHLAETFGGVDLKPYTEEGIKGLEKETPTPETKKEDWGKIHEDAPDGSRRTQGGTTYEKHGKNWDPVR